MDLDDTMTTSTSSSPSANPDQGDADDTYEDDNLFPESRSGGMNDRPRTPANNHLNATAPGELSPPRSQTQGEDTAQQGAVPNGGHTAANISATRSAARSMGSMEAAFEAQKEEVAPFAQAPNERDDRPGWGWKNKKAQEEMQRAWDNVVDRDFTLKEYGDVVMLRKAQLG